MFNLILKYTQNYKIKINFGSLFVALQSTSVKFLKNHMVLKQTFIPHGHQTEIYPLFKSLLYYILLMVARFTVIILKMNHLKTFNQ